MPDEQGKLSQADTYKVRHFLRAARNRTEGLPKAHPCPYCGKTEWLMGSTVVLDFVTTLSDAPVVPYVVFYCQNCTYSMRFNAVMMGLYEAEATPPHQEVPNGEG